MKKKAQEEPIKQVATLKGQASEEIPKEVIVESLKTLISEEELRQATASDQKDSGDCCNTSTLN